MKSAGNLKICLSDFRQDIQGSVAYVFAGLTPIIIAGVGFSTEATSWELTSRQLQNVSDIAAYAAATKLRSRSTKAQIEDAVDRILKDTSIDYSALTVDVISPPAVGDYAGDNKAAQINMSMAVERRFSKYFSDDDSVTISSTSIARVFGGRPACVVALHKSSPGALTFAGSSDVSLSGCDIAANSVATDAIDVRGSARVVTECASAVGGIKNDGGMSYTDCDDAIEEAPETQDPYANLAMPPVPSSCTSKIQWTSKTTGAPLADRKYCNGASVKGDLTLAAGVYYLSGGNWSFNASASVTGTDVTIYLTNRATLQINGGADFDIKAPTSGTYSGILIFGDRDDSVFHSLNGGSNMKLTGAIYTPGADISFSGSNDVSASCAQLVASQIEMTGNAAFSSACSTASGIDAKLTAQKVLLVQ